MKREWTVEIEAPEDTGKVYESITELTAILLRLGGVGGIAPHRVEQPDGSYKVDRVLFQYDSYAPGLNRQNGAPSREPTEHVPPAQPEPEPEEVEA